MHIIGLLLGVVAVVGFFVWRARQAAQATRTAIETAEEATLWVRRSRFEAKATRTADTLVDDPLVAAGVIVEIYAEAGEGDLVARQDAVRHELMAELPIAATEIDDIIGQARYIAYHAENKQTTITRLLDGPLADTTTEERQQLLNVMVRLDDESGRTAEQQAVLEFYAGRAGIGR